MAYFIMHLFSPLLLCWAISLCCAMAFLSPPELRACHRPACWKNKPLMTSTNLFRKGNHSSTQAFEEPDYREIIGDFAGIIVACQLIGLIDVLNDEMFWRQGGFVQPIPAVPSTLGTFVQRSSLLSVCWCIVTVLTGRFRIDNLIQAVRVSFTFFFLNLVFSYTSSLISTSSFEPAVILRDCYFVVLAAASWRFILRQMFPSG